MRYSMRPFITKLLEVVRKIPDWLWIVGFSVLAYGLLIPGLGFYLDDWYIIYYEKIFGAREFVQFFRNDRPFFAYVYMLFVPIFKDSALAWQIFTVATHTLAGITFWLLLKKLLPKHEFLAACAAAFFIVYPGFKFHWFSVMYSQIFFLLAIYFLSYIFMIEGMQKERGRGWLLLAAGVCLVIGIVPQEYFYGLELVRPLVIWIVLARKTLPGSTKIKQFILYWLPFLLVTVGFTVYRIGSGAQYSYQVKVLEDLKNAPGNTLVDLIGRVFWTVWDAVVRAWTNLIEILDQDLLSMNGLKLGVIFICGLLFALLFLLRKQNGDSDWKEKGRAILIGLFAAVAATAPFLASDYQISLEFPYNRFLIALAPGAAVALAAAVDYFLRSRSQKLILCAVLLALAIVSQFDTARHYRQNWQSQGELFWQLYWRAPSIEPGTALVTDNLPIYLFSSGQSLTAPLNLVYADRLEDHEIPYALIMMASPQAEVIPSLVPGQEIEYDFRSLYFHGNTSNILVFSQPSNGCLRVYSPASSIYEFRGERYEQFWQDAVPLSNLSLIKDEDPGRNTVLEKYFGREDRATWCYFYEKAELANQFDQWDETLRYYRDAEAVGASPELNREWLPLVKAALNAGDMQTAASAMDKILLDNQTTAEDFCAIWKEANLPQSAVELFAEQIKIAKCEK